MSSCRHLVLLATLAFVQGALAREPKPGADGGHPTPAVTRVADASPDNQLILQNRRDVLRQATRAQMEETPTPVRQLNAQERAELRQQLQQQRLELLR